MHFITWLYYIVLTGSIVLVNLRTVTLVTSHFHIPVQGTSVKTGVFSQPGLALLEGEVNILDVSRWHLLFE